MKRRDEKFSSDHVFDERIYEQCSGDEVVMGHSRKKKASATMYRTPGDGEMFLTSFCPYLTSNLLLNCGPRVC
jgi:hypothetical protein